MCRHSYISTVSTSTLHYVNVPAIVYMANGLLKTGDNVLSSSVSLLVTLQQLDWLLGRPTTVNQRSPFVQH